MKKRRDKTHASQQTVRTDGNVVGPAFAGPSGSAGSPRDRVKPGRRIELRGSGDHRMSTNAKPWLIAAWPGMGNVAVIAVSYLIQQLGMRQHAELSAREYFDVGEVLVKDGLVAPVRLPHGVFFRWSNPRGGRDLVAFIGEAQPTGKTYAYAHELMEAAAEFGVERVVTFASMASALHPAADPKVAGIATSTAALAELRRAEVEPMEDGQIGGLNGVVLAAAAEHGVSGMCLLAEIPYFAANIPNPKAARVALSVFSVLAGIDIALDELGKQADVVDQALTQVYEQLKAQGILGQAEELGEESGEAAPPSSEAARAEPSEPPLDLASRRRIERLFDEARKDRLKAVALKQELDRLGVFAQYENRFLDLFRHAD